MKRLRGGKKKVKNLKKAKAMKDNEPKITKLLHPDQFDLIENFFAVKDSMYG